MTHTRLHRAASPILAPLLVCLLVLGCAGAEDDGREAWLRNTLVQDNQSLMERDPALASGKLLKMGLTPYNYFRGTLGQFQRDMGQPGPGFVPTRFSSPEGSRVLLVGDPHVENIGSFQPLEGELVVDFNDFDAATYGVWVYDVRRLALSAWVMGAMLADAQLAEIDPTALAVEVARGYAEEFAAERAGAPPLAIRAQAGFGAIIDDLLRRAKRDGDVFEELLDYTRLEGDARVMFYGAVEERAAPDVIGDEVFALTAQELEIVQLGLARYPETLAVATPDAAMAFKGASRRYGAGVSSYPVLRFYVLVEGPTASPEDDWLLEFKEILNPNTLPGLVQWPQRRFRSNSERVVAHQRALQEGRFNDPLLGHYEAGPIPIRVRHRTKYQKGVAVDRIMEKLGEDEWSGADVEAFARLAGRLLARTHGQAPTLNGERGLDAVAGSLEGHEEALAAEIERFVNAYGPATQGDAARLQRIIAEHGPLLGYRPRGR